jgi:hypothetical protein
MSDKDRVAPLNRIEAHYKKSQEEIETYKFTIFSVLAFAYMTQKDYPINWSIYRNFPHPLSQNGNKAPIRPDCSIQVENLYGYVIEVKNSVSNEENEHFDRILQQLTNYDMNFSGWWTNDGYIPNHCVVLMTHQADINNFLELIENKIEQGEFNPKHNLSIIQVKRNSQITEKVSLSLCWGTLIQEEITKKLRDKVEIEYEELIFWSDNKLFLDNMPPTEYIMVLLWNYFNEIKKQKDFDSKNNYFRIQVNLGKLTKELQKLYGSMGKQNEVESPQKKWVQTALEGFVSLNLASRDPIDQDIFSVRFKLMRGDLTKKFSRIRSIEKGEEKQLQLFSRKIINSVAT